MIDWDKVKEKDKREAVTEIAKAPSNLLLDMEEASRGEQTPGAT